MSKKLYWRDDPQNMIAYLEIKRARLIAVGNKEPCNSIRVEIRDQALGYQMAINDLACWLNLAVKIDVDKETILDHLEKQQ